MFDRYIGIDYSGAGWPRHANGGLAICSVNGEGHHEFPRRGNGTNWSRQVLADSIIQELLQEGRDHHVPTLVGIDHAFSFPIEYFRTHELTEGQWHLFLEDFRHHWPTHQQRVVDMMADNPRWGYPQWRRLTDNRAQGAMGVFDFDGFPFQARVAKQTHAGLPWLLHIREALLSAGVAVHFWPFDGLDIPEDHSAIVEVYPALWNRLFSDHPAGGNKHRRDAYSVARWMWEQDQAGLLRQFFEFDIPDEDRLRVKTEGWIFGLLW